VQRVNLHYISFPEPGSRDDQDWRLAAAILQDGLARQGYACRTEANTVVIELPAEPDASPAAVLVVPDQSMLAEPGVLTRLDANQAVVVGSARPARTLAGELGPFAAGVAAVDAAGIAEEEGADTLVALLGGIARVAPFIDQEALCAAVWAAYDRGFGYMARSAMRAFDLGYRQTQVALH
jgi:hypothetical protein